jgi:hypothetical protein
VWTDVAGGMEQWEWLSLGGGGGGLMEMEVSKGVLVWLRRNGCG